jgi:hypothetical protein
MTALPASAWRQRVWQVPLPWPVVLVAGLLVAGLLALSGQYGFHRDELYFIVAGRHPAFGYVDQPPPTPLLSASSVALFGLTPTAVRVLPAFEMTLVVCIGALIAREFGGSRRAQLLAAITIALSGYLAAGHLDDTAQLDFLAWAVILWLIVKLLACGDRRLWLALGIATGIGLENKDTLVLLGAGLAVGLLLARRWDVIGSPWAWSAIAIALVLWAPNLAWQAANGWPQLTMASHIAGNAADNRGQVVPLLWLLSGPLLFPVTVAGFLWILISKRARPWRAVGIGAIVAFALVYVSGGKAYYAAGNLPVFMASGAVLTDRWMARGHLWLKGGTFAGAAVLGGALIAYLTLPILPVREYAKTSLPSTVTDTAEQIGWPQLVSTVEGVQAGLPPSERNRAVSNYGEAGALELLGSGLPPVYSGHNAYWNWGPPPADRTVIVGVGDYWDAGRSDLFTGCSTVAHIDDGLGLPNQEQGQQVSVCTGIQASWAVIWPSLRHLD